MKEMSWWKVALVVLSFVLFVACANESEEAGGNENNNEPEPVENNTDNNNNNNSNENNDLNEAAEPEEATVTIAFQWGEEGFIDFYKDPIEEALPHITVEYYDYSHDDFEQHLQEMIAAGQIPDILVQGSTGSLRQLWEYEIAQDLDELIDEYNYDVSPINDALLQTVRNASPDGRLLAFPSHRQIQNLYYNMDIFDTFGVSYPEDGMTWEEVIGLARDTTGNEGGIDYIGMDIMFPNIMTQQKPVKYLDPETDEVRVEESETLREIMQHLESLWSIPGIFPENVAPEEYLYQWGNNFLGELNVGMTIMWDNHGWAAGVEEDQGLRWDLASIPVFEDAPTTGGASDSWAIVMSRHSENPEATFEALTYLMSPEYQRWYGEEHARATVLNDEEIQEAFAANDERLADKNLMSGFLLEPNPGYQPDELSQYNHIADPGPMFSEFANNIGQTDVNSHLRDWQVELEAELEEYRLQQGE